MTFIKTLCILTAFLLISKSTSAQTLEKVFGKGDWEFHFDSSNVCVAATASGSSKLMVYTDKENSQINYLIFSGIDPLQSATLFIDGKKYDLSVSDNLAVSVDEKRPEIFSDMRAGRNAAVVTKSEAGVERELAFSLMGFTASVLKMQDYCDVSIDFEGKLAAAFKEKASRMIPPPPTVSRPSPPTVSRPPPPTVSREEYVRDVLTNYNIAIACADFGLLGEFTASYLKRSFSRSPKNDLTPKELDLLSELDIIRLRTLANDEEICGLMVLGLMFDPSGGDEVFFSNK